VLYEFPNVEHPAYSKLKAFLEDRPICREAAKPLSKSAAVRIQFPGDDAIYTYAVAGGRPQLLPGKPAAPDFTLTIPPAAVDRICGIEKDSIAEFGVTLMQLVWEQNENLKIRAAIHHGPLKLFTHGYFGILAKGGLPVMRFLASKGFGQIGAIRRRMGELVRPPE